MKRWINLIADVLNPLSPQHKVHLARARAQERAVTACLQRLQDNANAEVRVSTDEAAEF